MKVIGKKDNGMVKVRIPILKEACSKEIGKKGFLVVKVKKFTKKNCYQLSHIRMSLDYTYKIIWFTSEMTIKKTKS